MKCCLTRRIIFSSKLQRNPTKATTLVLEDTPTLTWRALCLWKLVPHESPFMTLPTLISYSPSRSLGLQFLCICRQSYVIICFASYLCFVLQLTDRVLKSGGDWFQSSLITISLALFLVLLLTLLYSVFVNDQRFFWSRENKTGLFLSFPPLGFLVLTMTKFDESFRWNNSKN